MPLHSRLVALSLPLIACASCAQDPPAVVRTLKFPGAANSVVWSADGVRFWATSSNGGLHAYGFEKGKDHPRPLWADTTADRSWIAVCPDRKTSVLVTVDRQGAVHHFEPESGKPLRSWDAKLPEPARASLSPDGKLLAIGSRSGRVTVYRNSDGKVWHDQAHDKNVLALRWSPDGKLLASGDSDGIVKIWANEGKDLVRTLQADRWFIGDLAWSPDGTQIATCSKTREVRLHEVRAKKDAPVQTFRGGTKLYAVGFSPDGRLIASGGRQDYVRLFDVLKGKQLAELKDPKAEDARGYTSLAWSPDGKRLAIPYHDGYVRIYSVPQPE